MRVISIRPGGAVEQAKPSIVRDDIIVEIDGQSVRSLNDLQARTSAAMTNNQRASLLVTFERGLERRLTVVEVARVTETRDEGAEASKAWVPVTVQVLTPVLARRLGLEGRTGVRVTRVIDPSTPLAVGDIILAIDGEVVRASSPTDEDLFAAMIRRARIGATVTLTIDRNGRAMSVPVTLGQTPKLPREMAKLESTDFEFHARDLVDTDAADPRLRGVNRGVLVESVSQGGWAALGRLSVNDIILQVDGHPIASVAELAARLKVITAARPSFVVFQIRRGIRTLFLEIRPEWR